MRKTRTWMCVYEREKMDLESVRAKKAAHWCKQLRNKDNTVYFNRAIYCMICNVAEKREGKREAERFKEKARVRGRMDGDN